MLYYFAWLIATIMPLGNIDSSAKSNHLSWEKKFGQTISNPQSFFSQSSGKNSPASQKLITNLRNGKKLPNCSPNLFGLKPKLVEEFQGNVGFNSPANAPMLQNGHVKNKNDSQLKVAKKIKIEQVPPNGEGSEENGENEDEANEDKQEGKKKEGAGSKLYDSFHFRSLGPALTSGRIVGFAIDPHDRSRYYVAVAAGGVWKTVNSGTTWTPIFDKEGSYSIGYITLDPKNPETIWVGTGENNSQRSVGYGDGVYKSIDGGKSWKNMGLNKSEHIGKIVIDPRQSDTVYVAAQGPLWSAGGDRGLYKTTDGGKTWQLILQISENTGVTDIILDPRHPDTLLAASYQRRRHVWTLINGGPESALHRSIDGGKTWSKVKGGLPDGELGRIGLAYAPSNPNIVYATIEASDKKGGIFRSEDGGITWKKKNPFDSQAQYYAHLVVDPKNENRIYVMNVLIQVSDDGGTTLQNLGERSKHVDNHTIYIDPNNPNYYLVGCDGGIYESFDRAAHWHFKSNLPVTQFYDIGIDENAPFYNVYGGTQDNYTMGGPSRTRTRHGITNTDWFVVQGGDGFHCKVDPKDPNIVYAEYQYAGLVRFDRRTGQGVGIQPQPGKGEPPLRWNWDSPLLISPHNHERIYFAANRLFRSDDQGQSWTAISGDLTRQLDRDLLPVMGKIWGPDTVAKHVSTSLYGNLVALTESPKKEGLIYVGSDDGLIQITDNQGKSWKKIEKFRTVPDKTYVSRLLASQHEENTVYASFDNHKNGDFQPYLLKSTDRGISWTSIAGDLPQRGTVLAIAEDHIDPNLLFVGTEFGLFTTLDGGKKWHKLSGSFPTIAVRDLAIQKQMNDLVVGTFGRGIYILDDYSPLRYLQEKILNEKVKLFPVRNALRYFPTTPYGFGRKGFLGESLYVADNPAYGATITYHLKSSILTKKEKRRQAEKESNRKGKAITYPKPEELRLEAEEEPPAIILSIFDENHHLIRKLRGPAKAGIHRITWDLTENSASTQSAPRRRNAEPEEEEGESNSSSGPVVLPGTYQVELSFLENGVEQKTNEKQSIVVTSDSIVQLWAGEQIESHQFLKEIDAIRANLQATNKEIQELQNNLNQAKIALNRGSDMTIPILKKQTREMLEALAVMKRALSGDAFLRNRNENTPLSVQDRIRAAAEAVGQGSRKPTETAKKSLEIAKSELAEQLAIFKKLKSQFSALAQKMDDLKLPWTEGRPIIINQKK